MLLARFSNLVDKIETFLKQLNHNVKNRFDSPLRTEMTEVEFYQSVLKKSLTTS